MAAILSAKSITKRFPGVLANNCINLEIEEGEIHALLGENGAGKTTLMNILYGLYQPNEGEIYFQGKPVRINSSMEAIHLGIGMVHQHFMLIPVFSVAENVILGLKSEHGILLETDKAAAQIESLSQKYGLDVDPQALIWQLSVGMQQRVEIMKALYRGAKLLILDEPTAVLTPQETSDLFRILRSLVEQGASIIFISHKLNEVMEISDRVTVLRNGCVVETVETRHTNPQELARMMVGREVVLRVERQKQIAGPPALIMEDLHALNEKGLEALRGVSLQVHQGEILGIAGVDGNGQKELAEVLCGLRKITAGRVTVGGTDLSKANPVDYIHQGVACVPQDRKRTGSIGDFSLGENLILRNHNQAPYVKFGFTRWSKVYQDTQKLVDEFDVRTPHTRVKAKALSGGNLQKLIFGREVSRPHKILVAMQPTRGLDVAAMEFVYHYLLEEKRKGAAILLISTELDEVLSLSDRIAVIYEGQIVGEMQPEGAKLEEIGLLMAGSRPPTP